MHRYFFTLLLLFLTGPYSNILAQGSFDRQAYYTAFSGDKSSGLDLQLQKITALSGTERDAFEGALLMRKAGTEFSPGKKLSLFKQGAKKLEAAIKADPRNVEYRFLRLMIQENAPGIVGYSDNLDADSKMVKQGYRSLSPPVQQAISSYGKQSRYL